MFPAASAAAPVELRYARESVAERGEAWAPAPPVGMQKLGRNRPAQQKLEQALIKDRSAAHRAPVDSRECWNAEVGEKLRRNERKMACTNA